MRHYDLYSSLSLDRMRPSHELVAELQQRLVDGRIENLGGEEEIRMALSIFGDDEKRHLYNSRIADPNAPAVSVDAIRELAAAQTIAPVPTVGRSGSQETVNAAGGRVAEQARQVKGEYKRSSRTALLITGVATALVTALLTAGVFSLLGGSGGGMSASFGNTRGVEKKAEEFLALRTAEEARIWLGNHTIPSERDWILSSLALGESSLNADRTFVGIDAHFDSTDPKVGPVFDTFDYKASRARANTEELREAFDGLGFDSSAEVMVQDGQGVNLGRLEFSRLNDEWKLIGIYKAYEMDIDELSSEMFF